MAKKVYIGQSDLARKVNEIYLGIDGKARKVVKGYVGVNGVARQFWPELILYYWNKYNTKTTKTYYWKKYNRVTTYRYYWDRYNVNETTIYNWNKYSLKTVVKHRWNKYNVTTELVESEYLGYDFRWAHTNGECEYWENGYNTNDWVIKPDDITITFNSNGSITGVTAYGSRGPSYFRNFYDNGKYGTVLSTGSNNNNFVVGCSSYQVGGNVVEFIWSRTPTYILIGTNSSASDNLSYVHVYERQQNKGSLVGQIDAENQYTYPSNGIDTDGYWYEYVGQITEHSKGDYIGTESSESSSTYPQDDIQNNYWYTYTGTSVEYSRGSANGSVNSTNRSQYPDDGKSGNYWYVYDRQTTSYSQGSYINQVSSTNRNQYPDNNYSGSYWYVYDHVNTTYSRGSYIGVVQSENPSAYPSNGRHTDGYWYVKQ